MTDTPFTPDYLGARDSVDDLFRRQARSGGIEGALWQAANNNIGAETRGTLQGGWSTILGWLNTAIHFVFGFVAPDSSAAENAIGEQLMRAPQFATITSALQLAPASATMLRQLCTENLRAFTGYAGMSRDPADALSASLELYTKIQERVGDMLRSNRTLTGAPLTDDQRRAIAQNVASSITGIPTDIATAGAEAPAQLDAARAAGRLTTGYVATLLRAQAGVTAETTARGTYVPDVRFSIDPAAVISAITQLRTPAAPPAPRQLPTPDVRMPKGVDGGAAVTANEPPGSTPTTGEPVQVGAGR